MTYYVVSRFIEIFKNVHLSIIEQWYKILSLQASMELAFEKNIMNALGNIGVHDERFVENGISFNQQQQVRTRFLHRW